MGGRLPKVSEAQDKKSLKKSNAELEQRQSVEKSMTVVDKLSCPKDMTKEAQKIWKGLMKLYKQMDAKILCDLDKHSLRMYCETYALYLKTQKQVEDLSDDSEVFLNKGFQNLVKTMNKQCEVCTNLAEKLCLTPIGRARMGVAVAKFGLKEEKSLDDFFEKFGEDDGEDGNEEENQGDEEVVSEDEEVANDEASASEEESIVNVNVESTINDFIERATKEEQEEQEESEDLLK